MAAKQRNVIAGQPGCSDFFMLGKVELDDPVAIATDLEDLRANLRADPYFKNVPSMQPDQEKTAVMFHAKDDIPEVRYEVFKLLRSRQIKFYAVARDKRRVVSEVHDRNRQDKEYRYNENELYDSLVPPPVCPIHSLPHGQIVVKGVQPNACVVSRFLDSCRQANPLENQKELNFTSDSPKVITDHSAKGLTFDTVLMPWLTSGSFNRMSRSRIERLLFVGITRTVQWVYLSTTRDSNLPALKKLRPLAESKRITMPKDGKS